MKHGRAVMPFGKWKGVRIRLLPDDYLSWLTTFAPMKLPEWKWLRDSLISELKFRDLRFDLALTEDPLPKETKEPEKRSRKFRFDL